MATKLLDISFWQGTMDFIKLKSAGHNHIILRAGYGTTKDSKFDEYAKGCQKAGINIVGVYWFIYATNISEVQANAKKCLEVIKPYNIPMVFADFEYDTVAKAKQKGVSLGSKECNSFTNTFCESVKKAGYIPGYYANTDYYKNMYTSETKNKGYVFWLAEYKSNYSYHEPSISCDFFQYTDRGTVSTLPGKTFDTNVCFSEKYLNISSNNSSNTSSKPQGGNSMSTNIIQKVINDAVDYAVGIANNNSHGYSQATRSLYNITNPKSFDCSSLVLTAYYYAFMKNGLTKQAEYLKANCSYTGNMMKMLNCGFEVVATNQTAHSQMQKGDIELNIIYHTAMAVDKDRIVHARTSEGTSDTKDNSGNEIRVQEWYLYSHGWDKRLRLTGKGIDFSSISSNSTLSSTSSSVSKSYLSLGDEGSKVKSLQQKLNILGYKGADGKTLTEDGQFGVNTDFAVRAIQRKYSLEVDGKAGVKTLNIIDDAIKKLSSSYSKNQFIKDIQSAIGVSQDGIVGQETLSKLPILSTSKNQTHKAVKHIQKYLLSLGYSVIGEADQHFGEKTKSGVKDFQKNNSLLVDGIVGIQTWKKMLM